MLRTRGADIESLNHPRQTNQSEAGYPSPGPSSALRCRPAGRPRQHRDNVRQTSPVQERELAVLRLRDAGETLVSGELAVCGHRPLPGGVRVIQHPEQGSRRHLSGVQHCSRHVCPVCNTYNQARRREQLQERAAAVVAEEPGVQHALVTLTARHHLGVRWRDLRDAIAAVMRRVQRVRPWRDAVLGFYRASETTWGKHGHHPHEHWLISFRSGVDLEEWAKWFEGYFAEGIEREGRTAAWTEGWFRRVADHELGAVVSYTTDYGVLWEVTGLATKAPPWRMPARAYAEVWRDSRGLRWVGSGGCWKISRETDEQLAEERERQEGEVIAHVREEVWRALPRSIRVQLLDLIYDQSLDREAFIRFWFCASERLGGVLGVGPP